jgi:predicted N-acyltransferase
MRSCMRWRNPALRWARQAGSASICNCAQDSGETLAVMPCYLKNHSQGEYVFDYGWADAIHRAGGRYYPKLQVSIPFTPASGPRVLTAARENASAVRAAMGNAAEQLCDKLGASSVHMTFLDKAEYDDFGAQGWLQRNDTQFHWHNDDFSSFDQFLDALSSRKRKNIRKERKAVHEAGLEIVRLTGSQTSPKSTGTTSTVSTWTRADANGARPTSPASSFRLSAKPCRKTSCWSWCATKAAGSPVPSTFIGGDTLYGRNWGCVEYHDCLHFEACYYQAIDFAIERGLKTVEAGAQGPHKLARGYLPVTTRSVHYIRDPRLHAAVADYLEHERRAVERDNQYLGEHSPFRKAAERDMAGDF